MRQLCRVVSEHCGNARRPVKRSKFDHCEERERHTHRDTERDRETDKEKERKQRNEDADI